MREFPSLPREDVPDDLDRLFARLERAPVPPDLTSRVLASTVGRTAAQRASRGPTWPWVLAACGALVALVLTGYLVGAQVAASDGLDLLEAVAEDLGLLITSPGDVAAALIEIVPWGLIAVAGASAALLVWASGHLSQSSTTPRPQTVAG